MKQLISSIRKRNGQIKSLIMSLFISLVFVFNFSGCTAPVGLEPALGGLGFPGTTDARSVATNEWGDAMSVWPVGGNIYAQRYRASSGWEDSLLIAQTGALFTEEIVVSMNGSRATVFWIQSEGPSDSKKLASLSYDGNGWQTDANYLALETPLAGLAISNRRDPQSTLNRSNAIWNQYIFDDRTSSPHTTRVINGSTTSSSISRPPNGMAWNSWGLDVATGPIGSRFIWARTNSEGGTEGLFVAHPAASSWDEQLVSSGQQIRFSKIAYVDYVDALAVWFQSGAIYTSYLAGWDVSAPFKISQENDIEITELIVEGNGKGTILESEGTLLLAWITTDTNTGELKARFRLPDGEYTPSITLATQETGNDGMLSSLYAGVDDNGTARMVWQQNGQGFTAVYHQANGNWSTPTVYTTSVSEVFDFAMDLSGFAIAVWNDDFHIWKDNTLTISKGGYGLGSVVDDIGKIDCGEVCAYSFPFGTQITITATPEIAETYTSSFQNWTGDSQCSDKPQSNLDSIVVTLDHNVNCTANFSRDQNVELSVQVIQSQSSASGNITSDSPGINCGSDCSEDYPYGSEILLTATPDAGSDFLRWNGDNQCGANANGNQTTLQLVETNGQLRVFCEAVFYLISQANLTVTIDGNGSVTSDDQGIDCGTDCSETYDATANTNVTLDATADAGYDFSQWTGSQSCIDGAINEKTTVLMNQHIDCTAHFVPTSGNFIVTVENSGLGHGTIASTPDGIGGNAGTCTFQAATASPAGCNMNTFNSASVTLATTPIDGAVWGGWIGCDSLVGNDCVINAGADKTVQAKFDWVSQATLTVTKLGSGSGTISGALVSTPTPLTIDCGTDCQETVTLGESFQLTAIADTDNQFIAWSGDGDCNDPASANGNVLTVPVDSNMTCSATFEPVGSGTYFLYLNKVGNGRGSISYNSTECFVDPDGQGCNLEFNQNAVINLQATAAAGSVFSGWGASCPAGSNASYTLTMPANDVTCIATFDPAPNSVAITLQNGDDFGYGTITSDPAGFNCHFSGSSSDTACETQVFANGVNLKLIATPDTGHGFEGWGTDGEGDICDRELDTGPDVWSCEIDNITSDMTVAFLIVIQ